ncbi:hypothetical protein [Streptomyces sp. Go40/10]|uniref:hypothetical protein n=1 Tax=Streptomyces sp. Go40/10 TaxID=2825844 RepID=UPI002F3FB640
MRLLAVTACPTAIAHTCTAAEKLAQAAASRGIGMERSPGRNPGWSLLSSLSEVGRRTGRRRQ